MITLTYTTTTLTLSPDLKWSDEFNWHPVEQTAERTITGALIVQTAQRVLGRPITLAPDAENAAWMPKATLDTLRAWAAVAGREMTLNLKGTSYPVIFRHHDGPAVEAEPVIFYSDPDGDDWFLITLRFTEVE